MRSIGVVILVLASCSTWVLFPRNEPQSSLEYLWASLFAAGALSGAGLVFAPSRFRIPTYGFLCAWLLLGIALFASRVQFVLEDGGSERVADSPMGFLTGGIFHQLITTVPATFLLLWLNRASRKQVSRYQDVASGSPDAV